MAGDEVRAVLHGPSAELGNVAARDLALLITGMESALAAAAYATLRAPRRSPTGRHRAAVERASRLRFAGVEPGSVVVVFSLPDLARESSDAPDVLDLELDDLAGAAFDKLVGTMNEVGAAVDRGVARAVAQLADSLGIGDRFTSLDVSSPRSPTPWVVDIGVRTRMHQLAVAPATQHSDTVVGSLREADFDRGTARLHTPTGDDVVVEFDDDLADDIYAALRESSTFSGLVTVDVATSRARRVEVVRIVKPDSLPFDDDAFWLQTTVADLAAAQGVGPWQSGEVTGGWTAAEVTDLHEALAELDT